MAELLIRPQMNDHKVIEDLLAPNIGLRLFPPRPVISRVVADAHIAEDRPELAQIAQAAGVPFLVDPNTPLLQVPVDAADRWCRLPFARPDAVSPKDMDPAALVQSVVDHQLERNATAIIPPYLYAASPSDPAFALNLRFLEATADYLTREGIRLPITVVAALKLHNFADESSWDSGIDRVLAVAKEVGASSLALCLSPVGRPTDNFGKVARVFSLASHALQVTRIPLIAWRQGFYGPSLVAAGFSGYETGIGQGESTDMAARASGRKVKGTRGFSAFGVFLPVLGRSVERKAATHMLTDRILGPELICDVPGCCPSYKDTLGRARHHAVRARAAMLTDLEAQPHAHWRLNHIMTSANQAKTVAEKANKVLTSSELKYRFHPDQYESLRAVVEQLLEAARRAA